jgi:hypothetical protein
MSNDQSREIGPFGRFIIFSGVGAASIGALVYLLRPLERAAGERALPYVLMVLVMTNVVLVMFLYGRCPRHLILPIGVAGWLTTFTLLFLWNWLGPVR